MDKKPLSKDYRSLYNEKILRNSMLNVDEAIARIEAPKSMPQRVWIELTNRCQLHCPMCLNKYDARMQSDFPKGLFENLAEEVLPFVRFIALTGGGETLMYAGFQELLEKITMPGGPTIEFVTNGILLTDKVIEQCIKSQVNLMVSMNGATKKTHESTRPGTKFENIVKKLKKISALKQAMLSNMTLGINFVILKNNFEEVPSMVDLAIECGVDVIKFFFFSDGGYAEMTVFHPDQDKKILNEYLLKARKKGLENRIAAYIPSFYAIEGEDEYNASMLEMMKSYPLYNHEKESYINSTIYFGNDYDCHEPWTTTFVGKDGIVKPCCLSSMVMGDLNKQSFEEIWHGKLYRELRRTINTDYMPLNCKECPQYAHLRTNKRFLEASMKEIKSEVITDSLISGEAGVFQKTFFYLKTEGLVKTIKRIKEFVKRKIDQKGK